MDQLLKEPLGFPFLKVSSSDGAIRVTSAALNQFSARACAIGWAASAVRVIEEGLTQ